MYLLRAAVDSRDGWWELRLLDLDLVADGDSEEAMLKNLERTLTAEYHLAIAHNQAPFVRLFTGGQVTDDHACHEGDKTYRILNLPSQVAQALSVLFRTPSLSQFRVKTAA